MPIPMKIDIAGDVRLASDYIVPVKDHLRDAWRWPATGTTIRIDLTTGREAVRDFLRRTRETEWLWLDGERAKAQDEDGLVRLAAIKDYAVKLRNAPAHASINAAADGDALRAITLVSIAGGRP